MKSTVYHVGSAWPSTCNVISVYEERFYVCDRLIHKINTDSGFYRNHFHVPPKFSTE